MCFLVQVQGQGGAFKENPPWPEMVVGKGVRSRLREGCLGSCKGRDRVWLRFGGQSDSFAPCALGLCVNSGAWKAVGLEEAGEMWIMTVLFTLLVN